MKKHEELTKSTHTLCSRNGIKTPIQWKLLYYLSYCFLILTLFRWHHIQTNPTYLRHIIYLQFTATLTQSFQNNTTVTEVWYICRVGIKCQGTYWLHAENYSFIKLKSMIDMCWCKLLFVSFHANVVWTALWECCWGHEEQLLHYIVL